MPGKLPSNRLFSQCLLKFTNSCEIDGGKTSKDYKVKLDLCFNLLQVYDHLKYGV